jgi:hypothetical protein
MPRFLLVVRDAAGKTREKAVTAPSEAEVAAAARHKGYEVVSVEPIHEVRDTDSPPLPAPPPTELPRRGAPPQTDNRTGWDEGPPGADRLSRLVPYASLGLAGTALLVSLATFGYVLWSDPLSGGLSRYDMSSPRAAYLSVMQREQKADLRAELEYQRRFADRRPGGRRIAEKIDTYEFRKEIEYGSRRGLLVSYKAGGEKRHHIAWFEKDDKTGWWVETDIPLADIEKNDRELADQLRRFEMTGEVPPAKK